MIELSPKEQRALGLLAQGSSVAEIAQAMTVSEHTVRVMLENASVKLLELHDDP